MCAAQTAPTYSSLNMSRSTHFSTFFCVAIFFTTRCSPIQGFNFFSSNETSQSIQSNHTNSSSDSSETNLYGLTYNTMFSDYNLSESAFPYYASHYIIHPMMNLNNRVANASQSLPKLLATGGESKTINQHSMILLISNLPIF